MAWWRHDPALWARSSAHRYAQRVLRDHEATLRTRCFSRTPSKAAQHQDHDTTGRPEGMTDLEWAQLQHYRSWRKKLQEHPYKALFGASEDMLRGKGLTDWEWVYKTFPKWMLKEMESSEWAEQNKNADRNDGGRKYGHRLEASPHANEQPPSEREPTFAQPVIKTTHYERDEFGIVSPSDLRRPKEAPHVKVVGKQQAKAVSDSSDLIEHEALNLGLSQKEAAHVTPSRTPAKQDDRNVTAKEAADRESSFIDAFFAKEPGVYNRDLGDSKSWRQTALQRRVTPSVRALPKARSPLVVETETPATEITPAPVRQAITIPSSQALVDNYPYPRTSTTSVNSQVVENTSQSRQKELGWSVPEPMINAQQEDTSKADSIVARSTFSVLEGLPKDDIDFLSAADIRASMGSRRSGLQNSDEKKLDREKLETGYAMAEPKVLDEVVEAHVLNNHYVRRVQQELERERTASEAPELEGVETAQQQPENVQMESSIDRMRRWIEEGGASFSKHFWQDPIETGAPSEADIQFAKQMAGLEKGRRAREHISDDLETDLPMCKGLLERLKNDENRVQHAVYLLRSSRKVIPGAEISKNLRTIRERRLRNTYERTEKQFESACQALRELDAEAVRKATNAFKRRLGIASRVLHKNHTLTRMLTWSAQARLDEPDLERSKAELYSEILTRLATLRDTQLALARLMDHAVQTYGVSFKLADEALSRVVPNGGTETTEASTELNAALSEKASTKAAADTAAADHLIDEIRFQKEAMQGLSDDGYARAPKQIMRRSFEENNPLAHSLFRPFNIQLESLGNKTEGEEAEEKLKKAFKQKTDDRRLVQEVRSAYEDVYGPITVEHQQVPSSEGPASVDSSDAKAPEMLKDEVPVSQTATTEGTDSSKTTAVSKPLVSETRTKETVADVETALPSSTSEATTSESSTTASTTATEAITQENEPSTPPTLTSPSKPPPPTSAQETPPTDLPTHYTILIHDPQTDSLSITTSTSPPPRATTPAQPIHEALSALKAPAKFIPHMSAGLEVVSAKRHMLVLRDALDTSSSTSTRGWETISAPQTPTSTTSAHRSGSLRREVNPVDGTARLSPTGFSGVEQSREQLDVERDFEERRRAAVLTGAASREGRERGKDEGGSKRRGGVGSLVKTVVWAGAVCYVVGVGAELLR